MRAEKKNFSKLRDRNYLKQVKGSILFKALGIGASFLLIPIMIDYVGEVRFGVWATMYAVLMWIIFFDLGLGNGLRNQVAHALARDDRQQASSLISTGYVVVGIISLVVLLLLAGAVPLLDWQSIFNVSTVPERELSISILVIGFFVILNFWLALVKNIYHAVQKTGLTVFHQFLANFLALFFIYLFRYFFSPSIIVLAFVYGLALFLSSLVMNLWFFGHNLDLMPKVSKFDRDNIAKLTGLGFQFFIIQISVIALFSTDKIIIAQMFGPEYVTQYEIVFRLFSLITIGHSIILAPLWSSYTEAYERDDFDWVRMSLRKTKLLMIPLIFLSALLAVSAPFVIDLWIGRPLGIDPSLIWLMAGFVLVRSWCDIYAYLLNGVGIIKIQMNIAMIQGLINIPLSIYLAKNFGVGSVVMATIISMSIFAVAGPIQTFYFLRDRGPLTCQIH